MQQLISLYEQWRGHAPSSTHLLSASGSNRIYVRMTDASDGSTVIGCIGTLLRENQSFVSLSRDFRSVGLPVPRILAVSDDGMRYIQQDLGGVSLFDALASDRKSGRYCETSVALLRRTISELPRIQVLGGMAVTDWNMCYPQPAFDRRNVMFDLNYFKYCFLKLRGTEFDEILLENDFEQLATDLLAASHGQEVTFMYRDFQARNVMLVDGQPAFIDYQGGRRGPIHYDLASFLWQASARYPDTLRDELIDCYLDALDDVQKNVIDRRQFRSTLSLFVFFRTLQVLGAYGFRGIHEGKKHFLDSIPFALANLRQLVLQGVADAYPTLKSVALEIADGGVGAHSKESTVAALLAADSSYLSKPTAPLVVRVFSFSFKKGIPQDESGNGGGYVFDCRSTHNPGRYEQYKPLTGLDRPVIDFLEEDGEILTFLESLYKLADFHVSRFIERGFTNLMFSCGCTGGRHRSVYSAQHLAEHIHDKYGVEVRICHREQGISQTLAPMQAMIFAAGMGTRLRPLTDTMPKALVPVAGKPLLQHVMEKLAASGVRRTVVNVHHFAEQIKSYLSEYYPDALVSDETEMLLETGGAIRKASRLFCSSPVLIHNVDILSNVNLTDLYAKGFRHDAVLLVSERETQRYLLFNDDMRLVGWTNIKTGQVRSPYPDLDVAKCRKYAFAGIHVISPALFPLMDEWPEKFPIIDFYLEACATHDIHGHLKTDLRLMDVGKTDTLSEAEKFIQSL